ncbi:YciI family protein [Microlunatus ginsengisoli]
MPEPRLLYVLRHRPGPAIAAGESVFDHPGIADHLEFLGRRATDGSLIAAGPLEEGSGEGMTVIAAASLAEAERLATTDDQSVVAGVLAVEVRAWQVVMDPGLVTIRSAPEPD